MRPNSADRLWFFVRKGSQSYCWPFIGSTFSGRYGRFSYKGKSVLAHRLAYELVNGPISTGLFVMHKCNNKLCCNPNHLTVGSNSENQRHASASGAWPVGKSGIRGITFDGARSYWVASGYKNGKRTNLYTGPHKEMAISARQKWERINLINFKESMT